MTGKLSSDQLQRIYKLLTEKRPRLDDRMRLTPAERALLECGGISRSDFDDLIIATEYRGFAAAGRYAEALAAYFRIPKVSLCRKPRRLDDDVLWLDGYAVADAVALLIFMERLGFAVSPGQLVQAIKGNLAGKPMLTESEYLILTYEVSRGCTTTVLRSDVERQPAFPTTKRHRDELGNRFTLVLQGEDVLSLEVAGPRYRDVNSALKTCAYCGTTYLPSSRNDREAHRQVHRETQRLLDPGPNKRFAARLKCGAGAERVDASVPMWMHQEVLKRAQRFRSDFAYDFVQWPGTMSTKATADWHGYLIPAGADGTIAGACAFLYETETNPSGSPWTLSWIWLAPKYRRGGLLRERWGRFLEAYGDFRIESPLSPEMVAFVRIHGTDWQKSCLSNHGE